MRKTHQQGYILIFVIWMLALVAVSAAYYAERIGKLLGRAIRTQQNIQAKIDLNDTQAEILFRLATSQLTTDGLGTGENAIKLDGREYLAKGNIRISLQDGRGLLNINQINDATLHRFLEAQGIDYPTRAHMTDTLRDYIDEDHLKRLNGAEKKEYEELGLSPPRNTPLATPREIGKIIGWEKNVSLARYLTVAGTGGLNPNTAPYPVLHALPGVNSRIADEIITLRSIPQLVNDNILMQLTGLSAENFMLDVNAFPSDVVRITITSDNFPWKQETTLKLTPLGEKTPWQINYSYKIEKNANEEKSTVTPVQLPARAPASGPAEVSPFG